MLPNTLVGFDISYLLAAEGPGTSAIPIIPSPWSGVSDSALQALLFLLPGLVTVAIIHALTVKQKQEPLERAIQALLYTFINHVTWQLCLFVGNVVVLIITLGHHFFMYDWLHPTPKTQLIGLGFCAVAWGMFITWIVNVGWLHDKLRSFEWTKPCLSWLRAVLLGIPLLKTPARRLSNTKVVRSFYDSLCFGITKRSSRPSEWYDAFYDADDKYVVVHLKDQRRIYGWAHLYPDLPTEGHLLIRDAEWLIDPPAPSTSIDPTAPFDSSVVSPEGVATETRQNSTPPILMNILIDVTDVKFIEFMIIPPQKELTDGQGRLKDCEERRREPEADRGTASGTTPSTST